MYVDVLQEKKLKFSNFQLQVHDSNFLVFLLLLGNTCNQCDIRNQERRCTEDEDEYEITHLNESETLPTSASI